MDRSFDRLLHSNSILRMYSLNQPPDRWLNGSIKLIDFVCFFRPIEFFAENVPAEAARVANFLPLRKECFAALQLMIETACLRQPLFTGAQSLAFEFRLAAQPFFALCRLAAKIRHSDMHRHPREQLPRRKRLYKIVVGVGLQSLHARFFARPRGQQDHWHADEGRVVANSPE